jgi:hypothetical protein
MEKRCAHGLPWGLLHTNIDRIAEQRDGFTDSYGEQSRTAGRAAFITPERFTLVCRASDR